MKYEQAENWTIYNGDCIPIMASLPDNAIDFSVYSPPFSSLYIYSDSIRDMGNVEDDDEFFEFYRLAIAEKLRVTKPGRLSAIHVKDLVYYSNASAKGDRGMRDFTGRCVQEHIDQGWTFHSRVTIWRCPVKEMQKSKPDGLLFRNFRTDAARVRVGNPEYLLVFRKWAEGMDETDPVLHSPDEWESWAKNDPRVQIAMQMGIDDTGRALAVWQDWASPVWMDTRETDVLNAKSARDETAEKHLCPMPLDITNRALRLWSNPRDLVLSPFAGIGSECVAALKADRRFVGCELKESYFDQAVRNIREADISALQSDFFAT